MRGAYLGAFGLGAWRLAVEETAFAVFSLESDHLPVFSIVGRLGLDRASRVVRHALASSTVRFAHFRQGVLAGGDGAAPGANFGFVGAVPGFRATGFEEVVDLLRPHRPPGRDC